MIKLTLEFETQADLLAYLESRQAPQETKEEKKEEPKEKPKKETKKKAKEKKPEKAREECLLALKGFLMSGDKTENIRKVKELMPEGETKIGNLTLEQAQEICLALEIEVE